MSLGNSNKAIAGSITERAEVIAAIGRLAEEVAHLALHFKLNVTIDAAAKAERAAEALHAVAGHMTEGVEPQTMHEAQPGDSVTAQDAQLRCITEAATTGTSLQPDEIVEIPQSGMDVVTELHAARGDLVKVEAASGEPKDASCHAKNAIATRVLELQDRLGGFTRP